MTQVPKSVSKYMGEIQAKRKRRVGGFSLPEVQKKALETRQRNKDAKKPHTP